MGRPHCRAIQSLLTSGRIAQRIAGRMDFGGQPAFAESDRFLFTGRFISPRNRSRRVDLRNRSNGPPQMSVVAWARLLISVALPVAHCEQRINQTFLRCGIGGKSRPLSVEESTNASAAEGTLRDRVRDVDETGVVGAAGRPLVGRWPLVKVGI